MSYIRTVQCSTVVPCVFRHWTHCGDRKSTAKERMLAMETTTDAERGSAGWGFLLCLATVAS